MQHGTYTVTFDGSSSDVVIEPSYLPTAEFTSTADEMTVSFDATASTGTLPLQYLWDFGAGNVDLGATPNYTSPSVGVFPVTLTVVDADNVSSFVTQEITFNDIPVAAYSYVKDKMIVNFKNESTDLGSIRASLTTIADPLFPANFYIKDVDLQSGSYANRFYKISDGFATNPTIKDELGTGSTDGAMVGGVSDRWVAYN